MATQSNKLKRAVGPEADKATKLVYTALDDLLYREPFFTYLMRTMKFVPAQDLGGMGTDGEIFAYDPKFVNTVFKNFTPAQRMAVMAHEALHIIMLHPFRREDRDPDMWNVACDMVVNDLLFRRSYTLPAGSIPPGMVAPHETAEDVYDRLEKNPQSQPNGGQEDKFGMGLDPGSDPDKKGEGEGGEGEGPMGGEALQDAQMDAQKKMGEAMSQAKEEGKMPGDIERLVDTSVRGKRDWRNELRKFLGGGQEIQPTWSRPNRRYIGDGDYLAGGGKFGPGEVVLAIDTSGSIDDALLSKFVAEVRKINEDMQPDKMHVVCCDAKVQWTQTYGPYEDIDAKPLGRGGTDFRPVFKWVEENGLSPKALCYFTDMECSGFPERSATPYPVLWIVWPGGSERKPPLGDVVMM